MRIGIHTATKQIKRRVKIKRKGLTKAEKIIKDLTTVRRHTVKARGVIQLIYNGDVLHCNTFYSKAQRDELIEMWSKAYAFHRPKKHELFIQIKLKENVPVCDTRSKKRPNKIKSKDAIGENKGSDRSSLRPLPSKQKYILAEKPGPGNNKNEECNLVLIKTRSAESGKHVDNKKPNNIQPQPFVSFIGVPCS